MLAPLVFAATGLLFIGLAIPLLLRRVRPNKLYGLRVPATFADEAVWYEANARSGRDLLVFGVCVAACALALPFSLDPAGDAYSRTMTALLVAGVILLGVVGWRRANRLLAERSDVAA